jgi:hypothetical protein
MKNGEVETKRKREKRGREREIQLHRLVGHGLKIKMRCI